MTQCGLGPAAMLLSLPRRPHFRRDGGRRDHVSSVPSHFLCTHQHHTSSLISLHQPTSGCSCNYSSPLSPSAVRRCHCQSEHGISITALAPAKQLWHQPNSTLHGRITSGLQRHLGFVPQRTSSSEVSTLTFRACKRHRLCSFIHADNDFCIYESFVDNGGCTTL